MARSQKPCYNILTATQTVVHKMIQELFAFDVFYFANGTDFRQCDRIIAEDEEHAREIFARFSEDTIDEIEYRGEA